MLTKGSEVIGFQIVRRGSPTTGRNTIYIFPRKDVQRNLRRRNKYFTKRRASVSPDEFEGAINEVVPGWVNYFSHTNASQASRALQRLIYPKLHIYVGNLRAGERVMANVSRFLSTRLRLQVNASKGAIAQPQARSLLEPRITNDGSQRELAPKALARFKARPKNRHDGHGESVYLRWSSDWLNA